MRVDYLQSKNYNAVGEWRMPTSGITSNYIPSSSTTASRYGLGAYRSGALSGSSHSNGLSESWSNSVSPTQKFPELKATDLLFMISIVRLKKTLKTKMLQIFSLYDSVE